MKTNEIQTDRRLLRQIERISQRVGRHIQERLARLQLTDLEAHVLWHLRAGGRPVGELQQAFGIHPSTLTGVIDRLETRGYARRVLNRDDRRSFVIELSPEGERAAAAVRAVIDGFDSEVRRRVAPRDLEGFSAVVAAIDGVVDAG